MVPTSPSQLFGDIYHYLKTRFEERTTVDLIAPSARKAILFNSGPIDGSGLVRVEMIMITKIPLRLTDNLVMSDRIWTARLKGLSNILTMHSAYAPIRDAPDNLKDKVYAELQLTLNKIPHEDILIIGGDISVMIGTKSINFKQAICNHGLSDHCINGVRLLVYAMLNNLSGAITWFKHKPCHSCT
ncbi:hypothetical protein QYM36_015564 [Artemia franciscana]|uniref:Uncharacterized protein n=1 Tax=Artemia franciscana TaxID=6661 RepID=A0AA88L076_ARTSF|nr:hypothetical protein QYM36_015564 [Artemia franciscana]